MAAPRTYTCEDVVELHCHGSQQIVKTILNLFQSSGIRLARPGEFTYRAFINGRLDLSQAEAVARLIHSRSDSSRKIALSQVGGSLSRKIHFFTARLKKILVLLEAWIDFPEEGLPSEDIARISRDILSISEEMHAITGTYSVGRVLSEGASIVLIGQPNVGKSSLLNALLGEDRAIVTDVPGTTRDLLEEGLMINQVPVRLVDTAGLRNTSDKVELEGVRRAEQSIKNADLVLLVMDISKKIDELDYSAYQQCCGLPVFLVMTKTDLSAPPPIYPFPELKTFYVSTKTGEGLDLLKSGIADFLIGEHAPTAESVVLSERRHYESLLLSIKNLGNVVELLCPDAPLELVAFEVREALHHLGDISGETTPESVLDDIFSCFCIGK